MKVGDLVKVEGCRDLGYDDFACACAFCTTKSNRVGVVLGPAPRNSWHIMFDFGEWRFDDFEEARGTIEVIGEDEL